MTLTDISLTQTGLADITLTGITLTPAMIMDIVLVLISALAVLYCAVLSRRLKRLNNLKTGLGGAIVTLTDAISDTHKAAISAQKSTAQTVAKLERLIREAESKAPKFDALIRELENAGALAAAERKSIKQDVEATLEPALDKAHETASALLDVVQHIKRYKDHMQQSADEVPDEVPDSEKSGENVVAISAAGQSRGAAP